MQLAAFPPVFEKEFSQYPPDQIPELAIAYGRIVTIMQTDQTPHVKIQSIMDIFAEVIEKLSLQEELIEELEEQKKILLKNNDKLILNQEKKIFDQEKLKSEVVELSNKVKLFALENGLTASENILLKQHLDEHIDKIQTLSNRIKILESEKLVLIQNASEVSKKAKEAISNKDMHLKTLEEKVEGINDTNSELEAKLDQLNALKIKEDEMNADDASMNQTILCGVGAALLTGGLALVPIALGTGFYGIHQGLKIYSRRKLDRLCKNMSIENPTASQTEIIKKIIEEKRKTEKKYGLGIK